MSHSITLELFNISKILAKNLMGLSMQLDLTVPQNHRLDFFDTQT